MRLRLLLSVFMLVSAISISGSAFAATQWDFSENFDKMTAGTYFTRTDTTGNNAPVGWSCYNSISSSDQTYDPHVWSRTSETDSYTRYIYSMWNVAHIGGAYNSSPTTYNGTYSYAALIYTFSTPTVGIGQMKFWWCRNDTGTGYFEYQLNGSTSWSSLTSTGTVYGNFMTFSIPNNTKRFRWRNYTYNYYYYSNLFVDNIEFKVIPNKITNITGYSASGINSGIVNLEAVPSTINAAVYRVEWEHNQNETGWAPMGTSYSDGGKFKISFDVSWFADYSWKVRATPYSSAGDEGTPYMVRMEVHNVTAAMTAPNTNGGVSNMMLTFSAPKPQKMYYPLNEWVNELRMIYRSTTTLYLCFYPDVNLPFNGSITKVQTNFGGSGMSSYQWKAKLFASGTGSTRNVVATSIGYNSEIGAKEYDVSWSNVQKGQCLGIYAIYGLVYNYNNSSYAPYTGNNYGAGAYYQTSETSTSFNGPYIYFGFPLRVMYSTLPSSAPSQVRVRYRIGSEIVPLPDTAVTYLADGIYNIRWDSWAVNSNSVYFDMQTYTTTMSGASWSGWQQIGGPYSVRNILDVSANIAASPGQGVMNPVPSTLISITPQGDDEYQFPLPFNSIEYGISPRYYDMFEVSVPQTVMDTQNAAWVFDYWSDGGARKHQVQILPNMSPNLIAYYSRQIFFEIISLRPDYSGPTTGYYDPGTLIAIQVPSPYSIVSPSERYRYTGYSVPAISKSGTEDWFSFNLTTRTTVTLNWMRQFYFKVENNYGQGSGSANGFYDTGTTVSFVIPQYYENGQGARLKNAGFMNNGTHVPGSGLIYNGILTTPTTIGFEWTQQYLVLVTTDLGTPSISPAGESGWFSQGDTVTINCIIPPNTDSQRFTFMGWTGAGEGSYTSPPFDPENPDSSQQNITVQGYMIQQAKWQTEYHLTLVNVNGTFTSQNLDWYPAGARVEISIAPPQIAEGSRYIPQWTGVGAGSFTSVVGPDVPTTINVTMNNAIKQTSEWFLQHTLTILNPLGYGLQNPEPGSYWYFDGDFVSGVSKLVDATHGMICTGFTVTGQSLTGSDLPYFNFVIHDPVAVTWNWREMANAPNQTWQSGQLITNVGTSPMAVDYDSNGNPVVAWFDASRGEIRVARNYGLDWSIESVASVNSVTDLDIYVNRAMDDKIFIAYRVSGANKLYVILPQVIYVKTDEAIGDYTTIQVPTVGDSGRNPHIAVNPWGVIFVSFYSVTDSAVCFAAYYEGVWDTYIIDSTGNPGRHNDISFSPPTGMPCVVYADFNTGAFYFAEFVNDAWQISLIDGSGRQGLYPSLFVMPDGKPYVSYQDATDTNNFHLRYATRIDGAWYTSVVDSTPGCGYNTSITVNGDGHVHIAHNNGSTALYSRYDGSSWANAVLGGSNVFGPTFVYLGNDGFPRVVYSDNGAVNILSAKLTGGTGDDDDDDDDDDDNAGGGGGGCFIATAAFGTISANAVSSLTHVRDNTVLASASGSSLVALYYAISPSAAKAISSCSAVRSIARSLLD